MLAAVAFGGMLGTASRYWLAQAHPPGEARIPWTTLAENLSGSFVLALLLVFVLERWPPTRYIRPFAVIGVLGSFTTFSSFAVEAERLLENGRVGIAVAYIGLSLAGGLTAAYLGIIVGRAWPTIGRRSR